jgi:hypothetical protein
MNDDLTGEAAAAARVEKRKVAAEVRQQIEEREKARAEEKRQVKLEMHGYFGPDQKTRAAQKATEKEHASELLRQMEVDRARMKDLKAYELAQDRVLIENQAQEIKNDLKYGSVSKRKKQLVLKQSWDQQVKMRQVRAIVQNT